MLSKQDILHRSREVFGLLTQECREIDEERFYFKFGDKWSVAENLQHLIVSTKITTLAFRAPGFLLQCVAGKSNRGSKTYDELVTKYKLKLAQGGKASGRFIPKLSKREKNKSSLLDSWELISSRYLAVLDKGWKETRLDQFLVKHPLLGRITLRELCYFTIYHTIHHHQIIISRRNE